MDGWPPQVPRQRQRRSRSTDQCVCDLNPSLLLGWFVCGLHRYHGSEAAVTEVALSLSDEFEEQFDRRVTQTLAK